MGRAVKVWVVDHNVFEESIWMLFSTREKAVAYLNDRLRQEPHYEIQEDSPSFVFVEVATNENFSLYQKEVR